MVDRGMGGYVAEGWVGKLIARLLAMPELWVKIQASLKKKS
jgi:hypothetical protein